MCVMFWSITPGCNLAVSEEPQTPLLKLLCAKKHKNRAEEEMYQSARCTAN